MVDSLITAAVFTVVGAVAVPLWGPLFRLAEKIRLKLGLEVKKP